MTDTPTPPSKRPPNRMDNIAQRDDSTKKQSATYSSFIRIARLALPIIAVIILAIALTWSNLTTNVIIPLDEGELSIESISRNELINPRFESRDEKGNPYVITAEKALQDKQDEDLVLLTIPSGEIQLNTEGTIAIQAEQGAYKQETGRLFLKGNVKVAHSQGTFLDTEELHIDVKNNQTWSEKDVFVENQNGTIAAKGLHADQAQSHLKFTGPAKMTIYEGSLKNLSNAPTKKADTP